MEYESSHGGATAPSPNTTNSTEATNSTGSENNGMR